LLDTTIKSYFGLSMQTLALWRWVLPGFIPYEVLQNSIFTAASSIFLLLWIFYLAQT